MRSVELISSSSQTLSDIKQPGVGVEILKCFSFYSNVKKWSKTKVSPDSLPIIHGLRFLAMGRNPPEHYLHENYNIFLIFRMGNNRTYFVFSRRFHSKSPICLEVNWKFYGANCLKFYVLCGYLFIFEVIYMFLLSNWFLSTL